MNSCGDRARDLHRDIGVRAAAQQRAEKMLCGVSCSIFRVFVFRGLYIFLPAHESSHKLQERKS